MPEQTKGVCVYLVKHEMYSLFPEYSEYLGIISAEQYDKIKTDLAASDHRKSTCMRNLKINYDETTIFGIINKTSHFKKLTISGMSCIESDRTPLCQNCTDKTSRQKLNTCAQNMPTGKCCDPLVRDIFCTALFPEAYAQIIRKNHVAQKN